MRLTAHRDGARRNRGRSAARLASFERLASWLELERAGTRLACCDYGGEGQAVVFLHGLAGHAGEWAGTAAGLIEDHRVLALDQRGHGRSERRPDDVSRGAFVLDIAHLVGELDLTPAVLVGHSMGGNTAFLAAAAYPKLVAALVVAEASPKGPVPKLPRTIQRWLDCWPTPFPSLERAGQFFVSQGLDPDAWTAGLERRADGLWPAFDKTVIVDCIADLAARNYRARWETIRCPTLIVRGEHGKVSRDHVGELARALPHGETATIPNARHDVHLDNPNEWLHILKLFLARHRPT